MAPDGSDSSERNFALNVADGVAFITGMAFLSQTAILPLFVAQYTDADWVLGLIPAIFMLGFQLPMLAGALVMSRVRRFWRGFLCFALVPRLALFALALTPFLPGEVAVIGFFVCFAVFSFSTGFQAPMWYEFLGRVIPGERRGAFFGYRTAFAGLASIVGAVGASAVLEALPGKAGFAACFALAALAVFVAWVCVAATRHDWQSEDALRAEAPPFWPAARVLLRENRLFRRYVVCRLLSSGALMAMAFYAVHAQRVFGLSIAETSLLAIALVHAPSMSGMLWGRLADRWGNARLQVVGAVIAGCSHGLLFVPWLPAYVLGLVGVGCGTTVFSIADQKWVLELDRERPGVVASFFHLAMSPAVLIWPLLGGVLAQSFGPGVVFALAGAAWWVGAIALSVWMHPLPAQARHEAA